VSDTVLFAQAALALEGVGDASLGEWREVGGSSSKTIVHVRRRLSLSEEKGVGQACDIRETTEALRRLRPFLSVLPPDWPEIPTRAAPAGSSQKNKS